MVAGEYVGSYRLPNPCASSGELERFECLDLEGMSKPELMAERYRLLPVLGSNEADAIMTGFSPAIDLRMVRIRDWAWWRICRIAERLGRL